MKVFDVAEQRQWLDDYEQDLFHIACLRCGAPFKHEQYAVAAPAEWFGVIDSLRDALDEIERLRNAANQRIERGLVRTVATLCPKCEGQKHVAKPPYVPGDIHQWPANDTRSFPCPLCSGLGYIETLGDVHYTGTSSK